MPSGIEVVTPVSRIAFRTLLEPAEFEGGGKLYSIELDINRNTANGSPEFASLRQAVKDALARTKRTNVVQSALRKNDKGDGYIVKASSKNKVKVFARGQELELSSVLAAFYIAKCRKAHIHGRVVVRPYAGKNYCKIELDKVVLEINHDLTKQNLHGVAVSGDEYEIDKEVQDAAPHPVTMTGLMMWAERPEEATPEIVPATAEDDPLPEPDPEPAAEPELSLDEFTATDSTPKKSQRNNNPPMKKKAAAKPKKKPAKKKEVKPKGLRYKGLARVEPMDVAADKSSKETYIVDIETSNPKDADYGKKGYLGAVGSSRYINDAETQMLMARVKQQGAPRSSDLDRLPPASRMVAHNAEFDVAGVNRFLPEALPEGVEVVDTMALANLLNFPSAKLGDACDFFFAGGVRKHEMPDREEGESEAAFRARMILYCDQDNYATEQLYSALRSVFTKAVGADRTNEVWNRHLLHQKISASINRRGIPIGREVTEAGAARKKQLFEEADAFVMGHLGVKASGKEKIVAWLRENKHIPHTKERTAGGKPKYGKKFVKPLLDKPGLAGDIARALTTRAATPLSKYEKMLERIDDDGKLRQSFQLHKAISGRFSSVAVQMQNIPKAKGKDVKDVEGFASANAVQLQQSLRRMVEAGPGRMLATADLTGVELRIAMHYIDRDDAFAIDPKTGEERDIYEEVAAEVFRGGDKSKVTDDERSLAKVVVLSTQYGAGARSISNALGISIDRAKTLLEGYNGLYPGLLQMRTALMNNWMSCPNDADTLPPGLTFKKLLLHHRELRIWRLPSGRPIIYWDCLGDRYEVRSKSAARRDGAGNEILDKNGKPIKRPGVGLHPGTLNAHVVSGTAVDVLLHGMELLDRRLQEEKLDAYICAHIHDELVLSCAEDQAHDALALMQECMGTSPPWMPHIKLKATGSVKKFLTGEDIQGRVLRNAKDEIITAENEDEEDETEDVLE